MQYFNKENCHCNEGYCCSTFFKIQFKESVTAEQETET